MAFKLCKLFAEKFPDGVTDEFLPTLRKTAYL